MHHSRLTLGFLGTALVMGAAPVFAQQGGGLSSVPPGAYREWPGTPAMANRPAGTAGDAINSEGGGAIPSLPLEVQTVGAITYVTGGVGDEEMAQLKASEHNYNLHMLLSTPSGAFISDVDLQIADAHGKQLLAIQDAGPYFYARLPEGTYNVTLTDEGETKKMSVKIGTGDTKKVVQFKEAGGVVSPHQPTAKVE